MLPVFWFRLVERFLMDGYKPQQLSTFALTLFSYNTEVNDQKVQVGKYNTGNKLYIALLEYHQ